MSDVGPTSTLKNRYFCAQFMEAYLQHILNDIALWPAQLEAFWKEQPPTKKQHISLAKLFNYEAVNFPPIEQLNEEQVRILHKKIRGVWRNLGIYPLVPLQITSALEYSLMLQIWEAPNAQIHSHDNISVHYCHQHLAICVFGSKHCVCGAKHKPFPQSHLGPDGNPSQL